MSVKALFLGGPMDGVEMILPDQRRHWFFATVDAGLATTSTTNFQPVFEEEMYELGAAFNNGKAIYRYVGRK